MGFQASHSPDVLFSVDNHMRLREIDICANLRCALIVVCRDCELSAWAPYALTVGMHKIASDAIHRIIRKDVSGTFTICVDSAISNAQGCISYALIVMCASFQIKAW